MIIDTLVVVVDRYGHCLLGLVLTDHVLIEKVLYLSRGWQLTDFFGGIGLRTGLQ